jgi:hypothetical protein
MRTFNCREQAISLFDLGCECNGDFATPRNNDLVSGHSTFQLRVTGEASYGESSDSFVASAAASNATGWSEPVPGRELRPLKSSAFSRRTVTTGCHDYFTFGDLDSNLKTG